MVFTEYLLIIKGEVYMDRIAFISDIHANIPALEAVLLDIKSRGINRIMPCIAYKCV